jgi:hypothetical protein
VGIEAMERRSTLAGVLALLGGLLMVASAFLPWARTADLPAELDPVSSRGIQDSSGLLVLAFGILAALAGVALITRLSARGRRAAALAAVVIGAAGITIGVLQIRGIEATTVARLAQEYASATGEPVGPIENSLKAALDIRPAYGLFVAVGGGALALVGGALGTRRVRGSATRGSATDTGFPPPTGA